jgi:beta-glucosidase
LEVNALVRTGGVRELWGFRGFVTSYWVFGTHEAV